jgi:hypothetical protein
MNAPGHHLSLRRRELVVGAAALAAAPAVWAHGAAIDIQPPVVGVDSAQAQLEHARRVFAVMARLGEPFAAAPLDAIQKLADDGQLAGAANAANAANAALRLLQSRVLAVVAITPEARVSVQRALMRAPLVQGGWRLYLVRIDNPAAVPGRLSVTSPHAIAVHGVAPPKPAVGGSMGHVGQTTTRGEMTERWLDLDLHDAAPLDAALEPLRADYKVLALYARDPGRRSASLVFDIGPGTGDLAHRDRTTLHFDIAPARTVQLEVRDVDGSPVTCSWLVTDAQGRVVPSQAKRTPPDFFFQQKVYRAHGQKLSLPAGEYSVVTGRGPEYLIASSTRHVSANGNTHWAVQLQRWVDPGARGWISGDHHIHAAGCAHYTQPEAGVGPEMLMPQVQGEALAIAGVLTWGPGFYAQKLNFSGNDDKVSTAAHKLHYDLEVSGFPSSHCGHLALLQMKAMDYPGTSKIEQWPSSNAPVLRWARAQGAATGYAHSGVGLWAGTTDLPNFAMPPFNGIGANDYIVTLPEGLVDFISTCNHPPAAEMNIWYHTLNVGLRSTIAGETDWPCFFEESLGMGRSYVKLAGALNYADWCAGLKAGRSYVSEGRAHLMDFVARSESIEAAVGGELKLSASKDVTLQVDLAARLEPEPTAATEAIRKLGPLDKPYWHIERARVGNTRQVIVELIVNGQPVEARAVSADAAMRQVQFDFKPERSCWVALRILNATHTNPIWITVADAPIRVKRSAQWCRDAVDVCWKQKVLRVREAERAEEAALYERGRRFYERMIAEASA